jgi:arylsulfatase A-like enzyme
VHSPTLFSGQQTLDAVTSHADLLPTMLGLAGLSSAQLGRELAATHNEVHRLVGRDLSGVILGEVSPDRLDQPIYFMTDDEPSRGADQTTFTGNMYRSVIQPNHIETVVAMLPNGTNPATTTVKTDPVPDQTEAYNVTRDPLELKNLTHSSDPAIRARLRQLEFLLHQQCHRKRLKPRSGVVPGQPDC